MRGMGSDKLAELLRARANEAHRLYTLRCSMDVEILGLHVWGVGTKTALLRGPPSNRIAGRRRQCTVHPPAKTTTAHREGFGLKQAFSSGLGT